MTLHLYTRPVVVGRLSTTEPIDSPQLSELARLAALKGNQVVLIEIPNGSTLQGEAQLIDDELLNEL